MTRIVNISPLLPEDVEFKFASGESYVVPGDPPLDLLLRIVDMRESAKSVSVEGMEEEATEIGVQVLRDLNAEILKLLQIRQPALESSPLGIFGVQAFVGELLSAYNIMAGEDPNAPDPTKPQKRPQDHAKSTRSSGSAS